MKHEKKIARLRECMSQLQDEKDQLIWDETMIALLEGVDEKDEKLMTSVLNRQWKYLQHCKKHGVSDEYGIGGALSVIMVPTVRRIFADFPIKNLVGIQPMNELVDKVFSLEYRTTTVPREDFFGGENSTYEKMHMEIIANDVEAGSRKLQGGYIPTTQEDLVHCRGIDLECEKIQTLSQEIRADINYEVLIDLKALGGEPEVVEYDAKDKEKELLKLTCRIRANCSAIAMTTRRGAGNWIVVSKAMATALSEDKTTEIDMKLVDKYETHNISQVGTMAYASSPKGTRVFIGDVPDNEILIGYKGTNGETDTGYFYCPYIPLMSGGKVLHPTTFKPVIPFMMRYGKCTTENVKAYYRNIKVEGDLITKK